VAASDHLEEAFGAADPAHFDWQTACPFVSDRERDLVRAAFLPLGERVLDLGCGEGATLVHLGEPAGAVGVDLFEDKLAFARRRIPGCSFVAASALALPFPAGSFDHVLVRDVIHHLDDPSLLIDEVDRVLAPGGRIDVLEPCRYNPLIALHAITVPVERGELRSTLPFLEGLVARRFRVVATSRHQPLPVYRVIFHPQLGRASLAEHPLARRAMDGFERLAERIVPAFAWAYLHVRANKPAAP
jgi:SAM-dependent methyltransferase